MILFHNDYSEGCHEKILQRLTETNLEQTVGYGLDPYCLRAAEKIRIACQAPDAGVHFLVGGTQANLTIIDAALRPHQAALGVQTAHINMHETGAVEATGHKIITVPSDDGKIRGVQIEQVMAAHRSSDSSEHEAQPKLVYISNPTELGTIYSRSELEDISAVCHKLGLYLFLDGARLGYGLAAAANDVSLPDIARLCDAFYIGGTKVGALFGEAVVIPNHEIDNDFRYLIKQHGGMLAKGRLLGIQFDVLFEDDLYLQISAHADYLADKIRSVLQNLGYGYLVPGVTNQIFPILPDRLLDKLALNFKFTEQQRVDAAHRAIRFCTSWATKERDVDALCDELTRLSKMI